MSEPERATVAVVSIAFINGQRAGDSVTCDGLSLSWASEDLGCAENLREQLLNLFGEPSVEMVLPTVAYNALTKMGWPGSVEFHRKPGDKP